MRTHQDDEGKGYGGKGEEKSDIGQWPCIHTHSASKEGHFHRNFFFWFASEILKCVRKLQTFRIFKEGQIFISKHYITKILIKHQSSW